MKGPRLNFHAERQLAGHPKTTFVFLHFVEFQVFKRLYSQLTFFNFYRNHSQFPNQNPPELLVNMPHTSIHHSAKDANTTYVFFVIFVHITFLRVLYNIHHHIAFAEELE